MTILRDRNLLPAGIALVLLFAATAPASAKHEFERGFENELGRIAAHSVVSAVVGTAFIGATVVQVDYYGHGRHVAPRHHFHPRPRFWRHSGHHYRRHDHYRGYENHGGHESCRGHDDRGMAGGHYDQDDDHGRSDDRGGYDDRGNGRGRRGR